MRITRYTIFFLTALILIACGSSKTAKKQAAQMAEAPGWVKERPVTNMYYIGIARVNKANYPDNYQEVAKRKALNDLASEISVNIQSSSIASSYEDQSGFRSDFSNYIQMEMSKDLAGYQMVGSYDTEESYMVYYRLSKAKWKEIQAERKKAAAARAATLLDRGEEEEAALNYPAAIKSYLNALLELKKYWNEAVFYEKDGKHERIDLEIQSKLSRILSDIHLKVAPQKLSLSLENNFKSEVQVSVTNAAGNLLKDIPVQVYYRKKSIPYQATVYTQSSPLSVPVEEVQFKQGSIYAQFQIDKDALLPIKSEDRKMLRFITDNFRANPVKVELAYILPVVYLKLDDIEDPVNQYIEDAIKQQLSKNAFSMTRDPRKADLIFKVHIRVSDVAHDNRLKTVKLNYTVEVSQRGGRSILKTFSSPEYKGVDYELNGAREKAFRKAAQEIESSGFKKLLKNWM